MILSMLTLSLIVVTKLALEYYCIQYFQQENPCLLRVTSSVSTDRFTHEPEGRS